MIDPERLALFFTASLILLVAPGPAILYVIAESLEGGRRAGVLASFGLTAGNLVHVGAATVGLSAVLAASTLVFGTIRYAGAAYLVFLGLRQLRARWQAHRQADPELGEPTSVARAATPGGDDVWRSFRRGLVVNVLNPKVALFFLAFFPQFVDPSRGSGALQLLVLGLLFALLTLLVDVTYALAAGTARNLLRRRWTGGTGRMARAARAGGYVPGLVYIGLGVAAALTPVKQS